MTENKFVLQLRIASDSQTFLDAAQDYIEQVDDGKYWEDEYSMTQREDPETGKPALHVHVPFHSEADAKNGFDRVVENAQPHLDKIEDGSYMHYHECATGATAEGWNCGEHVIEEVTV